MRLRRRGVAHERDVHAPPACRLCGGPTVDRWTLPVLRGRYQGRYVECGDCGMLQVVDPHWLADEYARESEAFVDDPDTGRLRRSVSACRYLDALSAAGVIDFAGGAVDFGAGQGLTAQMLNDLGHPCSPYDPFIYPPIYASAYALRSLDERDDYSVPLVISFEVFEHLTDIDGVIANLRRLLRPDGSLVISTGLYDASQHGPEWHYLVCDTGKHVALWTRRALTVLAARMGLRSVGYFPGPGGFMIVISPREPQDLQAGLTRAGEFLRDPQHSLTVLERLDFRTLGVAFDGPIEVDAVAPVPAG